ncbi:MAG TPA: SDR family NAD(P)-dependent oxidoreductase, partial [Verrucomicrobiae bacterium]|nr:SDR family NAD(P)-dependent oxidoreductase [Verrucomicrobiae bacterium]
MGQTADERYVLAEVVLPKCVSETREQYVLHPSVLDSALQASMGFALADPDSRLVSGKPSLPFELEEIEILSHTPAHAYIYVREKRIERGDESSGPARIQKFDIDICDEAGCVCVRLKGFTSRLLERDLKPGTQNSAIAPKNESLITPMQLVPVWDAVIPPTHMQWPLAESRVLLIGGTAEEKQAVQVRYPDVIVAEPGTNDFQRLLERKHTQGAIDHVVWLVPASEATDVTDDRLISEQSQGVLSGLQFIQALLRLGYETKNLGWTVVTRQTQAVKRTESIQPSHASIHGLIGALAKEYPYWKIRLVDLPSTSEWPLDEILSLPADAQGDAWAYRTGEWYRQQLIPCEFPPSQGVTYRHGGVYVVIGGAGGIGEAFSEHLIRNHQAQMVWIGRRELDVEIQAKLNRLATLGPIPSYIRADATDRDALTRAHQKIKAQHGQIHGLVHAAIALADKSLAQMDEVRFKASLAAKIDVSVRLAQVFAQEPMDFALFFSSLLSFAKPAGQSNYLAGCTFEDAFAHQLSQVWPCPVKNMNWGYWGSRGIVASESYRARMAQNGVGSIEPEEGMAALEQLLSAPMPQMALAKAQPRVLNAMSLMTDQITSAKKQLPVLSDQLSTHTNRIFVEPTEQDRSNVRDMQRLMGQLLFDQLRVLGLFSGEGSITAWKQQSKMPALYDRWLGKSLRVLTSEGYVTVANGRYTVIEHNVADQAALWSEWDIKKKEWLKDATLNAQVRMVDATLRALPEILTGKRPATEILFPKSSMKLVEGFYKGNPVADYFNTVLADAVVEFIELRRKHDPSARIRIVEIGAGTGGTSEGIFKRLKPYETCIAEYCYTDISKAFLMHAEQEYGPTTPYLAYRLLNVEQALVSQGMELGTYDLAVATNVLHATKNIRKTLRNAKGLLKHNGVLLLNEILGHTLFTHLTFGLLEGWWLSEDITIRIPGTPTLAPETWQRVLEGEGFQGIFFPASAVHAQGQQIIVAQSDGMIRQSREKQTDVNASTQLFPKKEATAPRPDVPLQVRSTKQTTLLPTEDSHLHRLRDQATASLKRIVGQIIKLPVHEIDSRAELEKYGIDSILIVSMVDALRNIFAQVTSTVFFECRTIDALVDHFIATEEEAVRRWVGTEEPVPCEAPALADQDTHNRNAEPTVKVTGRRQRNRPAFIADSRLRHNGAEPAEMPVQDIAIIGLSGRYPEAVNIEAYWNNLREGRDCIIEVPKERWDWQKYFSEDRSKSGCHYSKWGGFITGVDEFDPRFFNIAPSEAKYIDPQERLFLEHAWMAVEDAGYTRASLQSTCEQDMAGQVGVYVGVMYSEYQLFGAEASMQDMKMGFAGNLASIANRVSYVLNLHGPSMTLDTMCSSSLTAIHVACQDLKQGRTSLAIAGGVNVSVHPNKYLMLSAGQFISGDGHCQSFGEGGDGFIPAEGVGVVILKRLSEAKRDGDHIYGIIRGSAINHGGKTNGYTVPSPQAQTGAISRALAESHIDARHISYIEAHGTGTKLGDPIEISALSKAFQQHTQDTEFCLIGSTKSNIGHCESAAGIAGLTKVLLQMQHEQIVPSLHSERLNPHIDFTKTPFGVNQELRRWEQPEVDGRKLPRIAGISSFGAGGSNAHMIVEEYQSAVEAPKASANVMILLSARTAEQLKQKAQELLEFVRRGTKTVDLVSMAYTLQVGREAMEERLGLVVSSVEQLKDKLEAYVAGKPGMEEVYQGQVKSNKEFLSLFSGDADLQQAVEKWIANRKLSKLLELWVKGLEVDWSQLYGETKPQRMSLPTYPFARERYWIDRAGAGKQVLVAAGAKAAVLHPLLHSNTSDLTEQSYSATFSGEEFFLKDHEVNGQKALPAGAYLEMARAALQRAACHSEKETGLELRNVMLAQPMEMRAGQQVNIALWPKDNGEIEYEIYSLEGDEGEEIVHCQGQAGWSEEAVPGKLDIEKLKREIGQGRLEPGGIYAMCARMGLIYGPSLQAISGLYLGNREVLAQLRQPNSVVGESGGYGLHPSLAEGGLQAAIGLMEGGREGNQLRVPCGLDSLRMVSGCRKEMFAWVRYGAGDQAGDRIAKLDIDLCDEQGNVCVQMRGIGWQPVTLDVAEAVVEKAVSPAILPAVSETRKEPAAGRVRREIALLVNQPVLPVQVKREKPKSISLAAAEALVDATTISSEERRRPTVTLATATLGAALAENTSASSSVRLFDEGEGIFAIQIGAGSPKQARDRMAHLRQALERVKQETSIKVLKLSGLEHCFLHGGREEFNQAVEQNLYQAVVSFPYPVIAVLTGDAIGAGFLASSLCDLMVLNEDATYGYTDEQLHLYPTAVETELFSERFSSVLAQD